MIVVDANIITYFYVNGEETERVHKIHEHDSYWITSVLWLSEVRSALSLYLRENILDKAQAEEIVREARQNLVTESHFISTEKIFQWHGQTGLSTYDCEYVGLADQYDTRLVSSDQKIVTEAPSVAVSPSQYLSG